VKLLFLALAVLVSNSILGQGHFQSNKYICTTGNDKVFVGKHTLLLRNKYLVVQFDSSKWCFSLNRTTSESGKIDSVFYSGGRGVIYYTPNGQISSVWLRNPKKEGNTYYFRRNWAMHEKNQQ